MTTLLVSKVDNIPVIQVGDSKLIVKNKSQNASKVGGFVGKFGGIGFSGENKTVDIGKGRKEVSLRVFVDHRSDNDALFDILYNKRFCTIVDKFKGKIKVYVDSVTVTDSDKHVNRTLFDIKALVQDLSKSTSVNFTQNLSSVIDVIRKDKLGDLWKNLSVDHCDGQQTHAKTLLYVLYQYQLFCSLLKILCRQTYLQNHQPWMRFGFDSLQLIWNHQLG
jgi:hypothetical protein